MKKRILILLLVAMLSVCVLSGCGDGEISYAEGADKTARELGGFKQIDDKDFLAYDKDTKVIYYMFVSRGINGYSYTYFAPYISENGNFCKYVDGEFVEITEQVTTPVN